MSFRGGGRGGGRGGFNRGGGGGFNRGGGGFNRGGGGSRGGGRGGFNRFQDYGPPEHVVGKIMQVSVMLLKWRSGGRIQNSGCCWL